ncbi:signal transduction histidine kinase [Galbibacter orientalis DSM 19592]|uniref:histidine kinase n=1 Tax=Galbibacter orientalis DSM 19592 TaxID=926559 RepID=I3C0D7_9FLAO|nr:histidine kinase dimerization/phosphoacceptor domain -containing protein [Galbibacter orientalis]EIJ37080.1 signal transduction histidine kinase [Galbibacter orientalis DSM 19592]
MLEYRNSFRNNHFFLISFLLFIFCLISYNATSQDRKKADSIINLLNNKKLSSKQKAKELSVLAYYHPDLDSALYVAKQALILAKENKSPIAIAESWEEISHVERRLGNNDKSLSATLNALEIYDSLKLNERKGASYNQLASNYISDGNPREAIQYLKDAYLIYNDAANNRKKLYTLLNLGEAYRLSGYLDSAQVCFNKGLKLNQTKRDLIVEGYAFGNLGMIYAAKGMNSSSKEFLTKAITILDSLGDSYSSTIYLIELGKVYQSQDSLTKSKDIFLNALKISKSIGLKEQIRDLSQILSEFYSHQVNYKEALYYQKQFQLYQDSLVNKENIQRIERIKSGYEIDKKESEIKLLGKLNSNQKKLLIILSLGLIILFSLLYLITRAHRKIKMINKNLAIQKNELYQREQEKIILLRELNHRVKNNLQMISSLLSLQEQELSGHPAKEAISEGKNRVEALSLVHRKLYQDKLGTYIPLKEYITELVEGLFYGYGATFSPIFHIQKINLNIDKAVPLSLIVNEIIINALKYAYHNIANPELKINVVKSEATIFLTIQDNGNGFQIGKLETTDSFGIKLIYSLVKQVNGTISKKSNSGTIWEISFENS